MPEQPPAIETSHARPTLAALFSEPLTAILRVRYGRRQIEDPALFRDQMRRLLQTSIQEARAHGYSSQHVQMAVLATVGFLDESVLNLRNSASEAWARRPLQEELFGGHTAGETFFQNFAALLRDDSGAEVIGTLELHCHCILLGYKGRYAFGNSGELAALLRAAQEKIARAGSDPGLHLGPIARPAPPPHIEKDKLTRALLIAAVVLATVTIICYAAFFFSLRSGVQQSAQAASSTVRVITEQAHG
jgi:type VI secretion system protein ImpK